MLITLARARCYLFLVCACLLGGASAMAAERIVDVRSGEEISREHLIAVIAGSDFVLLGELHDNVRHHELRGKLIAELPASTTRVVAEYLEQDRKPAATGELLPALEAAGFDAKAWQWPAHQPLFAAIRDAGMKLVGGNISRSMARDIVRRGEEGIPLALADIIARSPLGGDALAALDADLLRGHCGQLPATMLPGLRLAQQARDAAMFATLTEEPAKPAILVAGDGHVRTDYGVPRLLRQHRPGSTVVSVAFVEEGEPPPVSPASQPYDYLWITEPASRSDPCETFKQPNG